VEEDVPLEDLPEWQQEPAQKQREGLLATLQGQGAFRRFNDGIRLRDLEDAWHAFRREALADIARDWLAAFRPPLQAAAFVAGFVRVVSFLWLAFSAGGYNAEIGRVFVVDIVALLCLVIGAGAYAAAQRAGSSARRG
jgi:hypothetical protein